MKDLIAIDNAIKLLEAKYLFCTQNGFLKTAGYLQRIIQIGKAYTTIDWVNHDEVADILRRTGDEITTAGMGVNK